MILCCGEALIDMLPRKDAQGEDCFAPFPGGAVFNTAIALGRLGAPVAFFSGLSQDFFGDMLRRALAEARVDASPCALSARPTTLAFVRLRDGQASYAFFDEGSAGRMLASADLPRPDARVQALFFGGISLMAEPGADSYAELLHRAGDGRLVMLDPNIRPGFIRDESRYRARLATMLAQADIVKLSEEDLAWLEGPGDTARQAQALLARGPRLVILTRGAAGASAFHASGRQNIVAPPVSVADTVGAGDTFNAAVLTALWRAGALAKPAVASLSPATIRTALDLGVRASAVTVSRPGADPPWEHEL